MAIPLSSEARFTIASDQSLLVLFDAPTGDSRVAAAPGQNRITAAHHEHVRRLLRLLELEPIDGIRNLHPAYHSLLIQFDPLKLRHSDLQEILRGYLHRIAHVALPEPRIVEIPVCYGGEYGPDLQDVAELHGISVQRAIEAHASPTYLVYFLGFAPGFAYLGDVPEDVATPRLPAPRKSVPTGSVGVAGKQTGVYPIPTPGGWRLLGRTPATMFRPGRPQMSLLSIGDRVRFVPISREQFAKLSAERA